MKQRLGISALLVVLACPIAVEAQHPTYAIRLKAVNGVSISGYGVSSFKVAPGDRLDFDITVRDWSPAGEMAAAIQATILTYSFTSGQSGSIYPIAYESTTLTGSDNSKNATIRTGNPNYIHYGKETVSFVDSINTTPGYRYLSMLFGLIGPISRMDGTEKYVGSVKSIVSDDASGTFTYLLSEDPADAVLITFDQQKITNFQVESAKLTISDSPNKQWIVSSEPGWRHVDAASAGSTKGINKIALRMRADASGISKSEFSIASKTGKAPAIRKIEVDGRKVTLILRDSIPAESWTTVTHLPSGSNTQLGRFFGDTNGDGYSDFTDLRNMLETINETGTISMAQGDMNGDETVDAQDIVALIGSLCK